MDMQLPDLHYILTKIEATQNSFTKELLTLRRCCSPHAMQTRRWIRRFCHFGGAWTVTIFCSCARARVNAQPTMRPDRTCQQDKTSTNVTRTTLRYHGKSVLLSAQTASPYLLSTGMYCLLAPPLLPLWAAGAMKYRMMALHLRKLKRGRPLQSHGSRRTLQASGFPAPHGEQVNILKSG